MRMEKIALKKMLKKKKINKQEIQLICDIPSVEGDDNSIFMDMGFDNDCKLLGIIRLWFHGKIIKLLYIHHDEMEQYKINIEKLKYQEKKKKMLLYQIHIGHLLSNGLDIFIGQYQIFLYDINIPLFYIVNLHKPTNFHPYAIDVLWNLWEYVKVQMFALNTLSIEEKHNLEKKYFKYIFPNIPSLLNLTTQESYIQIRKKRSKLIKYSERCYRYLERIPDSIFVQYETDSKQPKSLKFITFKNIVENKSIWINSKKSVQEYQKQYKRIKKERNNFKRCDCNKCIQFCIKSENIVKRKHYHDQDNWIYYCGDYDDQYNDQCPCRKCKEYFSDVIPDYLFKLEKNII